MKLNVGTYEVFPFELANKFLKIIGEIYSDEEIKKQYLHKNKCQ